MRQFRLHEFKSYFVPNDARITSRKKIMIVYSAEISGLKLATDSGISVCIEIQWTRDDSNVQGISKLKNQKQRNGMGEECMSYTFHLDGSKRYIDILKKKFSSKALINQH